MNDICECECLLLYLPTCRALEISDEAIQLAKQRNFELRGYKFPCPAEQTRMPRIVRVGVIQNKIVRSTTDPIEEQRQAIHQRVAEILEVASKAGVNVVCFQEAWSEFCILNDFSIL